MRGAGSRRARRQASAKAVLRRDHTPRGERQPRVSPSHADDLAEVRRREDAVLATEGVQSPANAIEIALGQYVFALACHYAVLSRRLTPELLSSTVNIETGGKGLHIAPRYSAAQL